MEYISTGMYLISGPILTTNFYDVGGDGPAATQIVQSNTSSNVFTVRTQTTPPSPIFRKSERAQGAAEPDSRFSYSLQRERHPRHSI